MNQQATTFSRRNSIVHLAGWLLAYALLFFISRHNHPNATINALASLCFIIWAFLAARINRRSLIPHFWNRRLLYAGLLVVMLGLFTLANVLSIQLVYHLLWFNDPRMFGFWTNMGLDFIVIAFFVGAAAALRQLRGYMVPGS